MKWLAVFGGLLVLAVIVTLILLTPLLFRRRRARKLARSGAKLRCHYMPDGRKLPAAELKSVPGLTETTPANLTNVLHRRDIDVATYLCDWPGRKQTIALLRFDTVIFQEFALRRAQQGEMVAFNPELIRFLERQVQPFSISGSGHWLMIYREGKPVRPDELSTFLGEVHSIASMIKRSVLVETQLPE
jgi:hypothetical protein